MPVRDLGAAARLEVRVTERGASAAKAAHLGGGQHFGGGHRTLMPPRPRIRLPHAHDTHNRTSTPLPPRLLLCSCAVPFLRVRCAALLCSLSLSSLTGPEFLVLPPLASYVRVVRDVVALPRGLFAILVGSLVMFRWGGQSFLRVWCDLLLLEGGAELSRESRITAAMVDFEISGLSRTGL
jgi:hypothetical protein